MKRVLLASLLGAMMLLFFPLFEAFSQTEVQIGDPEQKGVSGSVTASPQASSTGTGATVERTSSGMEIRGIASAVGHVDNRAVQGSAEGVLRINWGGQDRTRGSGSGSPVSPPGAPELPANWMFGTGFAIFGFGLLLYRRKLM